VLFIFVLAWPMSIIKLLPAGLLGLGLAQCGMMEGRRVSWLPSYGPEMRGGTAHCHVNISDEEIDYPKAMSVDLLLALTQAARRLGKGDFSQRVESGDKGELGELAQSFNSMAADLERTQQLRRNMVADIAHELRSPLSVISGYAEALSDGKLPGTPEVYTVLHQETRQLSRLVEDLRELSLAGSWSSSGLAGSQATRLSS
jgi:hypothetical protein